MHTAVASSSVMSQPSICKSNETLMHVCRTEICKLCRQWTQSRQPTSIRTGGTRPALLLLESSSRASGSSLTKSRARPRQNRARLAKAMPTHRKTTRVRRPSERSRRTSYNTSSAFIFQHVLRRQVIKTIIVLYLVIGLVACFACKYS